MDPYAKSLDPRTAMASQQLTVQLTGSKHAAYAAGDSRGGAPSIRSAIYLMVAGAVLLVATSVVMPQLEAASRPVAGAVTTTGTVSELIVVDGMCTPVVDFTAAGVPSQAFSPERSNPCPYSVGDRVKLSYLPANPIGSARLANDAVPYELIGVLLSAVTWALIVGGAVALVYRITRLPRSPRRLAS